MKLQHTLHEENINVSCIQETHLKKGKKTLKIRGYETFKWDKADRRKGGILILITNNINTIETAICLGLAGY